MTSARRPAGAPEEERRPAGAPKEEGETAAETSGDAANDESGAAVDADFDALLADVKRERDEYLEIAQRARADFENYRRRAAREAQEAERRGKSSLARELVPAVDNLERALRAAGVDPETPTGSSPSPAKPTGSSEVGGQEAPSEEVSAHEALARGVALVYGELRAALERAGVETYDPTGERFDPSLHEALATRPGDDAVDPGVVLETLEKGYRLDGQVLRAARVIVSE
ncbi:MAG TPA: nucleotide exchange factor GrpE [Solirubrobacterales bacterium]|nr:nucleotide exchange factor GrpE [Solirubrobacterales bacterium]